MTQNQIKKEREQGKRILARTAIEDYLVDDEVLNCLCLKSGCQNKIQDFLDFKNHKLAEKGGNAKAIVNDLRMWSITTLGISNAGDNFNSFLTDTMAPIFHSEMRVFKELEKVIFSD